MRLSVCLAATMSQASLVNAAVSFMTRHVLPTAVCSDGSQGHYYMATNASSKDYIVFLQGGLGCAHNLTRCDELMEEAPPLFTSTGFPEEIAAYGILSGNAEENTLYNTYNRIYVPYCSMDLYLLDTQSPGGDLQFRGRPLLEETLTEVLKDAPEAATLVLGGSSAGGVGAFNAAQWVLESFGQVSELSLVLDSALFFDVHGYLSPMLDYIEQDPTVAYDTHCSEEFNRGPCCAQLNCMFQRGYYPRTDPRLRGTFVVNALQDGMPAYQIAQLGTYSEDTLPTFWDAATYTGEMGFVLRNLAILYPEAVSVFSPSCTDHSVLITGEAELHHCLPAFETASHTEYYDVSCVSRDGHAYGRIFEGGASLGMRWKYSQMSSNWETLRVSGASVREAMEAWWVGRGLESEQVALFDDCDDINCNPTCSAEVLPGLRDESESLMVWLVVGITLAASAMVLGGAILAVVWGWLTWREVQAIVAAKAKEDEEVREKEEPVTKIPKLTRSPSLSDLRLKQAGRPGYNGSTTPILEWQSLSYWVPQRGSSKGDRPSEKQLLHSVDGAVPEGALCALMGPSGSGKSTLLDLLTGRRAVGRCEGELFFEGRSIVQQQDSYILKSGYMRQDNTGFLDGLSVFDNLVYACMLRMPGTLEAQIGRVETVLEETALLRNRDAKAGSLSGGQKRRLTLALELLADRRILFLDEPTSGLDATASLDLLRILKRLSRKVTLVVAIHQPRPEIWRLFSHTILLKSGRAVYCGPPARALGEVCKYIPTATSSSGRIYTKRVLHHRGSLSPTPSATITGSAFFSSEMSYRPPRSPPSSVATILSGGFLTTEDDADYDESDVVRGRGARVDDDNDDRDDDDNDDISDSYSSSSESGLRDRGSARSGGLGPGGRSPGVRSQSPGSDSVTLNHMATVAPAATGHGERTPTPRRATGAVAGAGRGGLEAEGNAGWSKSPGNGPRDGDESTERRGRQPTREKRGISRNQRRSRPQIIPVTSSRESLDPSDPPVSAGSTEGAQGVVEPSPSGSASTDSPREPNALVVRDPDAGGAAGGSRDSGRKHALARTDPAGAKVRKGSGGIRRPAGTPTRGRASERASPGEDKRLEGAPEDDESSSSFSFVSYTPSHATSVASPSRVSPHAGTCSAGECSSNCSTPDFSNRRETRRHGSYRSRANGENTRRAGGVFTRRDPAFDATRPCESGGDTPRHSVEARAWRQRRQQPLHATALMTEDEEDAASLDNSDWRTSSQRSLPRKVGGRLLTLPQLLGDAQRSVPDKILDLLVTIDDEDLAQRQAKKALKTPKSGLSRTQRDRDALAYPAISPEGGARKVGGVLAMMPALLDVESGYGTRFREEEKRECSTVVEEGSEGLMSEQGDNGAKGEREHGKSPRTPPWKVAAILLARSAKSGYAMDMVAQFGILESAILLMAGSFRIAQGETAMFHLVFSVLLTMVLPVLLMYHPVLIPKMWEEWSLARNELADGFYPSVCVTLRVALDHLSIGVLASFSVVTVMHVVLWEEFISALPVSSIGVNAQLSCGVTLMAWVMITLFDALTISGMKLTHVFTLGVALSAVWAFYSGTVMLITSLPMVLKFVSYTSPHFWSTSFMLRVILDGLDMSADCDYESPLYCATSYGDLIADAMGLHERVNGTNVCVMILFATGCTLFLTGMVEIRGRRCSIFGGLQEGDELEGEPPPTQKVGRKKGRRRDRRDRVVGRPKRDSHPKNLAKTRVAREGLRLGRAGSHGRMFGASSKRASRRREQQVGPTRVEELEGAGSSSRSVGTGRTESVATNVSMHSPATSTASAATINVTAATAAVLRVVAATRNATASLARGWMAPLSPPRVVHGEGVEWPSESGGSAGPGESVTVADSQAEPPTSGDGERVSSGSESVTPLPSPPPVQSIFTQRAPVPAPALATVTGAVEERGCLGDDDLGESVVAVRRGDVSAAGDGSAASLDAVTTAGASASRGDQNVEETPEQEVQLRPPTSADPVEEQHDRESIPGDEAPVRPRRLVQRQRHLRRSSSADVVIDGGMLGEKRATFYRATGIVTQVTHPQLQRGDSTPIPPRHPVADTTVGLDGVSGVTVEFQSPPRRFTARIPPRGGSMLKVGGMSTPPAYGAE